MAPTWTSSSRRTRCSAAGSSTAATDQAAALEATCGFPWRLISTAIIVPGARPAFYFGRTAMVAVHRRQFLKTSVASVASLSALSYARAADSPNDKVVLAMIGIGSTVPGSVGGRGRQLLRPFSSFKDVDIAYLCDVDENFFPSGQKLLVATERQEARVEK